MSPAHANCLTLYGSLAQKAQSVRTSRLVRSHKGRPLSRLIFQNKLFSLRLLFLLCPPKRSAQMLLCLPRPITHSSQNYPTHTLLENLTHHLRLRRNLSHRDSLASLAFPTRLVP